MSCNGLNWTQTPSSLQKQGGKKGTQYSPRNTPSFKKEVKIVIAFSDIGQTFGRDTKVSNSSLLKWKWNFSNIFIC